LYAATQLMFPTISVKTFVILEITYSADALL